MSNWSQENVHAHMRVYSANQEHIGHVAQTYEDSFLLHKGYFLPDDRYLPYSTIAQIVEKRIELTLSSDEVKDREWEKRPDYEDHLGDPTQLFYDRGHGVHDPYE